MSTMETSAFAQRLAANQQTQRDRSIKKLRKFIATRAAKQGGFSQQELLQLWKGLHYCMWMQDKPLLQEELSSRLCGLLKAFPDADSALAFAAAFFTTQAKEWGRLDQWRMDKFMMLIRDFLHATLELLQRNRWEGQLLGAVAAMIGEVVDAGKEDYPDGLRLHLADIYLEELEKVGAQELTGDQINILLQPFVEYLVNSKRDTIANKVMSKVFFSIIASGQGGEEPGKLQFDFQGLRQTLFDAGRQQGILPKVRQKLYKMVKRFSEVCGAGSALEGSLSQESESAPQGKRKRPEMPPSSEEEPKKKKRKASTGENDQQPAGTTEVTDMPQPETPASPKKKQHKNSKNDTPQSAPRHVAFDLQRNSSQELKDFVESVHQSPCVPPTRSPPAHGILKDSPGVSTSHSQHPSTPALASTPASGKWHVKSDGTPSGRDGTDKPGARKPSRKGKAAATKSSPSLLSRKQSRFASKKRERIMKKPKHR